MQLQGRDAAGFAQAQFMSDVSALAPGCWHWSGWLTPKGRVVALFALLRLDEETLWLLLPDAEPVALVQALQRYVFRSKVKLSVRADMTVQGEFAPPRRATGGKFAGDTDRGLELDLGGDGGPRTLRIDATDEAAADDASLAARWRACDLCHGLPRLDDAQAGQWTPQQLSLDRLRAYSVKKGCYPGQEIVARTHFLGQAKRGLVLLEGVATIADGSEVHDGERAVGTVASTAGALALAVMPLERDATTSLRIDGNPVHERPLLDGLARQASP